VLYWAIVFLIFALAAAIPGFTVIALVFAGISAIQVLVFVTCLVASLISHAGRRTWQSRLG